MKTISNLLRAGRGLKVEDSTRDLVSDHIIKAFHQDGAKKFISLISILHTLASSQEYSCLCSAGYNQKVEAANLIRL